MIMSVVSSAGATNTSAGAHPNARFTAVAIPTTATASRAKAIHRRPAHPNRAIAGRVTTAEPCQVAGCAVYSQPSGSVPEARENISSFSTMLGHP